MSNHSFKYLFHQFFNKKATPQESAEFLSLLKRDEYNEELKVLLDKFWEETTSFPNLNENNAEKIFSKIMAAGAANDSRKNKMIRNLTWWKAAAAVLIVISFSALFYRPGLQTRSRLVKETKNIKISKPDRRFINLPDGSSVALNENSGIEFGEKFIVNGKREVYLKGEAYFDIVHDSLHPFIVHTGKLQTTVLGTAFNINASSMTGTVIVTVTRGKVKVGDKTRTFNVIDPDEQMVFSRNLGRHFKKPVDVGPIVAWKNEDIYFDDVTISNVASQLQERFNVSIIFSNKVIRDCRFSATFLKTQSLEQILNVIAEFNHIKYQYKDENTILLDGTGCN